MTLTTSEREEAERMVKLLERTVERLSEFKFPELIVIEPEEEDDDEDDEYDSDNWVQFKCPWCRYQDYIENYRVVSVGSRKSPIAEPDDSDQSTFEVVYDDADNEFTDTHLECSHCGKPVSLPSQYDLTAY